VGCIPSKSLLDSSKVIAENKEMADIGIDMGTPQIDIKKVRAWKDGVVKRLTGGLAMMAKQRQVTIVQGTGQFTDDHTFSVDGADGSATVTFDHAVIAAVPCTIVT
jgi:dihydrolipoamide dehydrogenase